MIEVGLRGGMTQTTCKKVEAWFKYDSEITIYKFRLG